MMRHLVSCQSKFCLHYFLKKRIPDIIRVCVPNVSHHKEVHMLCNMIQVLFLLVFDSFIHSEY